MPRKRARLVVALAVLLGMVAIGVVGYKVSGSRSFQFFGGLTDRVETSEKVVALTFDDGPTPGDLDAVLAPLRQGGVRASFYLIGAQCAEHRDAVRRIIADGHEVGNHTWSHRRMVGVLPGDVASEIEPTDACLRESGWTGQITVRPPYGSKLLVFPAWLAQRQRRTIMWDVSVEDFSAGAAPQSAEDLAAETVAGVRPGSIVLLHPWDGRAATQQAIPLVIRRLRAQGYRFVTVSELLAAA